MKIFSGKDLSSNPIPVTRDAIDKFGKSLSEQEKETLLKILNINRPGFSIDFKYNTTGAFQKNDRKGLIYSILFFVNTPASRDRILIARFDNSKKVSSKNTIDFIDSCIRQFLQNATDTKKLQSRNLFAKKAYDSIVE